jgi:molecular chaperone Hsp33
MTDTLQKFIFDNAAVKGEFVELSATWQEVLQRHAYPAPVKTVLGQMLAAAALLSANLKFNGAIIMQVHGDGPVRLLVVECDAQLRLRATAKLAPDAAIADDASLTDLLNAHGRGRFVITLDPLDKVPGQQPYQGIVPLDGADMATVIENYMLRSEQLDTRLWLAADATVSRGLLLQKLPRHSGKADQTAQATAEEDLETWQRAVDAQAGRTARDRHFHADEPAVLGRDDPRVRARASAFSLQLHARESGQYAQDAGSRRNRRRPRRTGPAGHQLRFLRQAL